MKQRCFIQSSLKPVAIRVGRARGDSHDERVGDGHGHGLASLLVNAVHLLREDELLPDRPLVVAIIPALRGEGVGLVGERNLCGPSPLLIATVSYCSWGSQGKNT